ncbi:hypothetical protein P5V15_011194 [Pogonomyrmex californicus]
MILMGYDRGHNRTRHNRVLVLGFHLITSGLALSPAYARRPSGKMRASCSSVIFFGVRPRHQYTNGTSMRTPAAQIELLLGVDASDRASSGGRPETPGVIAGVNPDNEAYSPDTDANADVPPTNLSTPRSCAPDDFVCADGTCIPETHHCDHFYDCRDFTDEQYCFG